MQVDMTNHQREKPPSTLDLSALAGPPPGQVATANNGLDSLESQMAALHGSTGASTPWHTFSSNFYGQ
jgi:hypothetical protein